MPQSEKNGNFLNFEKPSVELKFQIQVDSWLVGKFLVKVSIVIIEPLWHCNQTCSRCNSYLGGRGPVFFPQNLGMIAASKDIPLWKGWTEWVCLPTAAHQHNCFHKLPSFITTDKCNKHMDKQWHHKMPLRIFCSEFRKSNSWTGSERSY